MQTTRQRGGVATAIALLTAVTLWGCSPGEEPMGGEPMGGSAGSGALSGQIQIDGSSTVYPITEAMAEEFMAVNSGVQITVGISGTGGGFQKFGRGETAISDASRPIKSTEAEVCAQNGINFIELPVAYDALTVVVNPKNTWATTITVDELKKIWEPAAEGKIMRWSQVRAGWPDRPLKLYGPGSDSGTFDYFTDAINGEEGASRADFTSSEDDNVLVQGVAQDQDALGFFGLAYYMENQEKLTAVRVDDKDSANGDGPQAPTMDNVIKGLYQPLARPIFIYVSSQAADKPEVKAFVEFYLRQGPQLVESVGYVPLQQSVYDKALARFNSRKFGSIFTGGSQVGVSLDDLLAAE